ncbi:MAG: flagellar hook-basal body complex protein FliE [Acidobacteria bacterium]|nr:flagellar hook-basal body complex protein FliE [Acidobacteriota bacterium]
MDEIRLQGLESPLSVPELKIEKQEDDQAGNFGAMLKEAISEVNRLQIGSETEVQKFISGESKDIHTAMIALQRADSSFQMLMQVRNKIVSAYQEIMRMQV